ncbi:MAG: hypothetical protein PHU72_01420 [Dethiosulfovibrio sp.]|nr:hypothetical protein [Dethiosulfovibrio sp.]
MIQQNPRPLSSFSSSDLIYLMEEIAGKTDSLSVELLKKIKDELDRRDRSDGAQNPYTRHAAHSEAVRTERAGRRRSGLSKGTQR